MAYRNAELFVAFLHDTNPAGFARMMNAGLDDHPFAEAVTAGGPLTGPREQRGW
jgi:hypothetical protein